MNRGYNVSDITPIIKVIWLHYSQFSHLHHGERQSLISKVTETLNLECNRLSPSFFFFFKIFLMWNIFKVLIEFVTILLLFCVLDFWPKGMWDPSSWPWIQLTFPQQWKAKFQGSPSLPTSIQAFSFSVCRGFGWGHVLSVEMWEPRSRIQRRILCKVVFTGYTHL